MDEDATIRRRHTGPLPCFYFDVHFILLHFRLTLPFSGELDASRVPQSPPLPPPPSFSQHQHQYLVVRGSVDWGKPRRLIVRVCFLTVDTFAWTLTNTVPPPPPQRSIFDFFKKCFLITCCSTVANLISQSARMLRWCSRWESLMKADCLCQIAPHAQTKQ